VKLTIVGCAGSFPGPDSPASSYLLEAEGYRLVLDLGNGALGALARYTDIYAVDAVLLSHLHPDHFIDMCSYYVARTYKPDGDPLAPLPVHGPRGTAHRVASAYGLAKGQTMDRAFTFKNWRAGSTQELGPFRISVDRVNHPVEAYAMRIEHDGRVLTYSGDTAESDTLVRLARDADLFLCEASFHEGRDDGVQGLHLTGRSAGAHATAAGARRVVLTHLPPWNDPERTLAEASSTYSGPIELARAGATYDI
jgi:ribonuclease BN (tRNA processing enzyme)